MAILTGVRQCLNEVLARIPLTDPSHWTSFHFSVTICSFSTERHLRPLLICNPYFSFLLLSCMNSLYKFWVLTPQYTNGLKFCRLALYSVDFFPLLHTRLHCNGILNGEQNGEAFPPRRRLYLCPDSAKNEPWAWWGLNVFTFLSLVPPIWQHRLSLGDVMAIRLWYKCYMNVMGLSRHCDIEPAEMQ